MKVKKYKYFIGIDTGVVTGFGVSREKKLRRVESMLIHKAIDEVRYYSELLPGEILVRVEDPRLRKWIPKDRGREALQGVGSVKRDAKIWEDFLRDAGIDYELVPPKNNKTKVSPDYFKKLTGWTGSTNEHGRDAAMLVFGL